MALFKKPILSVGKYLATKADGTRALSAFPVKKLRDMAKTANAMIADGMHIPAPFDHSIQAVPITEKSTATSYANGGYWNKFWVSDESGKPTLYGELDAPGDVDDFNSPAGKVGKTVKEVSLSVRPEFEDGKGKKWTNPLMHVALCTHPIDHGQSNFELAEDNMAISMSCMLSAHYNESDISTLREKLKSVANIFLPETCDAKNLVEYLLVSLQQIELGKTGDSQEDDTVIEPSPVFLSLPKDAEMKFTKEQAESVVKSGAVNPATSKPYTLDDLGFQLSAPKEPVTPTADVVALQAKVEELTLFSAALTGNLLQNKKSTIASRIQSLVDTSRVTKDYADKHLTPHLEGVSLSYAGGKIADAPIESVIAALEAIPAPKKAGGLQFTLPSGAVIEENDDNTASLSDEEMNAVTDDLLSFIA